MTTPDVSPSDRAGIVAQSTLIVIGGAALSFGTGLLRRRVIAGQFGTTYDFDAYSAVDSVSELIVSTLAVGALVFAFLPLFVRLLEQGQRDEANRLASRVLNLLGIMVGVAAIGVAWFAPALIASPWGIGPGYAPAVQALMVDLLRTLMLSMILFAVSSMITGILHAHRHFWLPAIAPSIYSLGVIAGAWLFAPTMGIRGLAWGAVLGAALHLLVQLPGLLMYRFQWSPSLGLSDPNLRRVMILMAPRILDLLLARITLSLVGANLNSYLGEGRQSAMSYAYSLMNIPWTLIGTAIGFAIFPALASLAASGDLPAQRDSLNGGARATLILTIPAAAGLLALGRPLIQILYAGGNFTAESVELVYYALQFYVIALISQSLLDIVVRAYAAQQDTLTPLIVSLFTTAINVGLAIWLTRPISAGGLEHGGPPLANGVAVGIEALIGLTILHIRWKGIGARRMLVDAVKALAAAGVMSVVIIAVGSFLSLSPLLTLAVGGILGTAAYWASALSLGISEMRTIPLTLFQRLRRRLAD